jgi:cytochrome c peroxidase
MAVFLNESTTILPNVKDSLLPLTHLELADIIPIGVNKTQGVKTMQFLFERQNLYRGLYYSLLILLAILFANLWPQMQRPPTLMLSVQEPQEISLVNESIQPIPLERALDPKKVLLGEKLFQDVRLSKDNRVSCLTCHAFNMGGTDRRTHSLGVHSRVGEVNTPTIFNVRYNFRLNWNGKFETLTDHIEGLLTSPTGMDMSWDVLIQKLKQVPEYQRTFSQIYSDGMTSSNIKDGLVVYEESLNTPNSRFDRFLRGDKQALAPTEQEGYRLFKEYGCASCHQGINAGGNLFQRFGVMGNYFADRGKITQADLGRFNVTQDPADRFVFRVPSLRNVAQTAPYFHDGTAQTLEQAIAVMAKYQLGRSLPVKHINRLAEFLKTLTGEYQGQPLG